MEKKVKFSKKGKILLFNYFPEFVTGITTKKAGDLRKRIEKISFSLNYLTGKNSAFIIKPEHSDNIAIITTAEYPANYLEIKCDAIIYNGEKTFAPVLMCTTGDCPIIVLTAKSNYENKIIMGIVHSGWRGTALSIVSKSITQIIENGGQNIKAIVWPGICGKCYKVGDDLYDKFPAKYFNGNYLNLGGCIEDELNYYKVDYYVVRGFCPHCKGEKYFFSHRKGCLERNGVFITLK